MLSRLWPLPVFGRNKMSLAERDWHFSDIAKMLTRMVQLDELDYGGK